MGNMNGSRQGTGKWAPDDWRFTGYDDGGSTYEYRQKGRDSSAKRRDIERRKARRRSQRCRDW